MSDSTARFVVSIALEGGVIWQFMFNKREDADRAVSPNSLSAEKTVIKDDYGANAEFETRLIMGYKIDAYPEIMDMGIQIGLHQARAQVRAQNLSNRDPVLSAARNFMVPGMVAPPGAAFGDGRIKQNG